MYHYRFDKYKTIWYLSTNKYEDIDSYRKALINAKKQTYIDRLEIQYDTKIENKFIFSHW